MANKTISDVAIRQQVLLERFKSGKVRDYLRLTRGLNPALLEVLAKLEFDKLSDLTKHELRKVIVDMKAIEQKYNDIILSDLTPDLEDLSADSASAEARIIDDLTPDSVSVATPKPKASWAAVRTQPIAANGQLLEPFLKSWGTTRKDQLVGVIQNAYRQGETLNQIARRVRGTRERNFKDGLTNLQTRQAEAVIRTAVQHDSATSRIHTMETNSDIVVGYEWVSTLDSRTTDVCRSLDGNVYLHSGGTSNLTKSNSVKGTGNPVPPIHIGCRSTIVPVLDPELGLDFLNEGAERSAVGGEVSADLTYYDWLKTQPLDFQVSAIGKGKAELLNDGSLTSSQFAKISISKTFQPLTLAEMRAERDRLVLTGAASKPTT